MAATSLGDYEKVKVNALPSRSSTLSPETKWWRKLQQPQLIQQHGVVSHCEYQPIPFEDDDDGSGASHGGGHGVFTSKRDLLVTCATRLLLYDYYTQRLKKQFTRFSSTAYGGTFRRDGRMVAAGSDTGVVQLFSVDKSRDVLRQLHHSQNGKPVQSVRFMGGGNNTHLVTGGDDALVKYWDITLGDQVATFGGHSDYCRSVSTSRGDPNIFLTGGYDHRCFLWDARTKDPVRSWVHASESPVEDVLILPSGTMAVSCGSTKVRMWDILSGKLMASLDSHQKTVTTVRHVMIHRETREEEEGEEGGAERRSWKSGPRLLTGSVDGHVKVYELDTFGLVHSTKYPNPVLSFDCTPGANQLAVGMANGVLAVRSRPKKKRPSHYGAGGETPGELAEHHLLRSSSDGQGRRPRWRNMLTANSYRYFLRGQNYKLSEDQVNDTSIAVASKPKKVNLKPFDKSLKKFRYREALDQSLQTRDPSIVLAVLEQLCAQGGDGHALQSALSQRNASSLQPIMKCLCKYVADPRTMKVSVPIAHALFDLYTQVVGISNEFDTKVMQLYERVHSEMKAQEELIQLQGMLEPLLFAQYSRN
ncbi:U3 small nucleolar RNA-associated protein Utp15 [Chloropicon primus]|uniref:U3 small nucleolar RNA-associated protein Utp15 n=1 Tax=Chloropicon primus TaxID=1764295 RepID=A0A5B8MZW7_9CHLO|nr:U3 small nucleolar RNA-associated protein Utp15 [Chloropicon primus]UPR05046.1 U3 small nucleolar RNA-associated protein Utp15 [Chloropicon primus]|eukprot:QDZ25851.1 U3 small nucleolar RNA-associated protein Utp15 [Chloropicon primus]